MQMSGIPGVCVCGGGVGRGAVNGGGVKGLFLGCSSQGASSWRQYVDEMT